MIEFNVRQVKHIINETVLSGIILRLGSPLISWQFVLSELRFPEQAGAHKQE